MKMPTAEIKVKGKAMTVDVDAAHIKGFGYFGDAVKGAPRYSIEELEKILTLAKAMDIKTVGVSIVEQSPIKSGEIRLSIILSLPGSNCGIILAPSDE